MRVTPVLIAAAANRFSSCSATLDAPTADNGTSRCRRKRIVFGSGKCIAVWSGVDAADGGELDSSGHERLSGGQEDVGGGTVQALLGGHWGEVTVVKNLQEGALADGEEHHGFVSGDSKGGVVVWRPGRPASQSLYEKAVELPETHNGSVSALASYIMSAEETMLVTGGSDALLKIWRLRRLQHDDSHEAALLQKISLGHRLPLDAELTSFGSSDRIVLAVGSTDPRITVYTACLGGEFMHAASLPGHADWVRCLSFHHASASSSSSVPGTLLLATGSQDCHIRLWRFVPNASRRNGDASPPANGIAKDPFAALDALEASLASSDTPVPGQDLKVDMKKHPIVNGSVEWGHVTSEAVLMGHEGWVTNVRWCSAPFPPALRLLSTSVDRSMILWSAPEQTGGSADGLWLSSARFGELSFTTNLGFFGAHYLSSANGREIVLASGWGGAWHVWRKDGNQAAWKSIVVPTGHFKPVSSVSWDRSGELLLSSSLDQTSRIWAAWTRDGTQSWHEVARPQIHGHDVFGAVFVGADKRTKMVSIGEEKVLRAFEATKGFVKSIGSHGIGSVKTSDDDVNGLSEGAVLPPLGLSNKMVKVEGDEEAGRVDEEVRGGLKHPPFEEQLLSSTLWPECAPQSPSIPYAALMRPHRVDKLFGHPSELLTVTASSSGRLIASACNANAAKHAAIRLWDASTWRPVGSPLEWHGLGVGALRFRQAAKGEEGLLISASRDRGWALWAPVTAKGLGAYDLVQGQHQAHSRIIHDVAWAPEVAGEVFATASRDKTVKVWGPTSSEAGTAKTWTLLATIKLSAGARSVDIAPLLIGEKLIMAVGLEDGEIVLFASSGGPGGSRQPFEDWQLVGSLDQRLAHVDAVTNLAFSPPAANTGPFALRLATGGEDRTVRIFDISLSL